MKRLIVSLSLLGLSVPLFATGMDSVHPSEVTTFIETHSPLIYLAAFFGLGVLLAFTPCVLPMVPILSGIISGQNAHTGQRAFQLSLGYVLGMATTYAIAGMLAAYFGSTLQTLMQQPLIIALFSGLFILMACWLLGVFDVRMPSFLNKRVSQTKHKQRGVLSAAVMGSLSTLVVSPCVTAPLIGILAYIGQSGRVLQGGLLLFVLALGMGLPLLMVGAGYGKLLPSSGHWMVRVKQLLAVLMVAMAIWLLGRILPMFWLSVLWTTFLVLSSVILGIGRHEPHVLGKCLQGVAVFALMSAGALAYKNVWVDESKIAMRQSPTPPFVTAHSLDDIYAQLAEAKAHHKAVYIEFFASWCSDCQAMDNHVFNQPEVITAMRGAINMRVSLSEKTESVAAIKKALGIYGIPTMIFYNADGVKLDALLSVGQINKDQMLHLLGEFKALHG